MLAEAELQEYLDEIRTEVCSRCVERPAGGPPCGPLGKPCGVELHLPKLIESIQEVQSHQIGPYLQRNRKQVCESCALHHGEFCPCPMDTLAVLVVEAVEAVNERQRNRSKVEPRIESTPDSCRSNMEELGRVYKEATGTWRGCDWPTVFGQARLDLQGFTAAEARARAGKTVCPEERKAWKDAAFWLEEIERRAEQAEVQASLAMAAANAGQWQEAAVHAQRAWALEFSTGRFMRHAPTTWRRLYEVIDASTE